MVFKSLSLEIESGLEIWRCVWLQVPRPRVGGWGPGMCGEPRCRLTWVHQAVCLDRVRAPPLLPAGGERSRHQLWDTTCLEHASNTTLQSLVSLAVNSQEMGSSHSWSAFWIEVRDGWWLMVLLLLLPGPSEAESFQLEMSGLLSELACPYTVLTSGDLSHRFLTRTDCLLLLSMTSTISTPLQVVAVDLQGNQWIERNTSSSPTAHDNIQYKERYAHCKSAKQNLPSI